MVSNVTVVDLTPIKIVQNGEVFKIVKFIVRDHFYQSRKVFIVGIESAKYEAWRKTFEVRDVPEINKSSRKLDSIL